MGDINNPILALSKSFFAEKTALYTFNLPFPNLFK